MASFSTAYANKVLDHIFGGTPLSQPAGHYVALHTGDPGDAGTANEVTGGSYSRQPTGSFTPASAGNVETTADVNFPDMPAVTVTHASIHELASGTGSCIQRGPLVQSRPVQAGETFRLAAGDIDSSLS